MRNKLSGKIGGSEKPDEADSEYNGSGKTGIDIIEGPGAYGGAYSADGYKGKDNKPRMHISIKRFIIAIVAILVVIVSGSVLFVGINTYYYTKRQTSDYIQKTGEVATDLKKNLDAVNEKFITEELKAVFSKDDIYVFSYSLWSYGLYVNDTKVASTANLTIKPGDKIYVREDWKKTVLPEEFIAIGRLTRGDVNDSLKNHFALGGTTYVLKENKEEQSYIYEVGDMKLKAGETFNILLSAQLARRLNFEREVITVKVKG